MFRFPILLIALLLVPTVQAGWFSEEPLEIVIGDAHAGTYYRFEETMQQLGGEGDGTRTRLVIVHVEDSAEANAASGSFARDRYGVTQPVDVYRIDVHEDDALSASERCYALQRSQDAIRRDLLLGSVSNGGAVVALTPAYTNLPLTGESRTFEFNATVSYESTPCLGRLLPKMRLSEGAQLPLGVLAPELLVDERLEHLTSAPAERAEHFGEPALRYRFDLTPVLEELLPGLEGSAAVTVSQFSAVVSRLEYELHVEGREERFVRELTGFRGGDGYVLPFVEPDVALPLRNPAGAFILQDPLLLDDQALGLPFPYADALEALRADPSIRFSQWAGDGSDVRLVTADYDRQTKDPLAPNLPTDGGWSLLFSRGETEWYFVQSVRVSQPPTLPAQAPVKAVRNYETTAVSANMPAPAAHPELANSRTVATVLDGFGLDPQRLERLSYANWADVLGRPHSFLMLSDVSASSSEDARGHTLHLDLASGGLTGAYETIAHVEGGSLLGAFASGGSVGETARGNRLNVLVGPGFGENMDRYGAAAATGLALLILAAKFLLFPLFTRLRRDRLLDNDVRARLYEQVRREPGVHRAALVEFAGIGEGATRHHLQQLVKHRLVVEVQSEGFARYFAAGEMPADVARREAALHSGSARRVYELYRAKPEASLRQAAQDLGLSAPSVHRYKKKLEKAGLLPAAPGDSETQALIKPTR